MGILGYDARRFFLLGMRVFFGLWLLYAGVIKWVHGPRGFVGQITEMFDKTWSPHWLNVALAWLILIAEPVLAVLILSGIKARVVWGLTALLMFQLVLGMSIAMHDVTGNWIYLVLALACAALSEPEGADRS